MNSLILWVVAKLMRKRASFLHIAAGGLAMALLHGILLFARSVYIHPLAASVFILSIGVVTALRPKSPRQFLFMMLLGYASSFTVGGLGMGLFYLTDLPYAVSVISADMTGVGSALPWYLPVICVLFVYLSIKLCLHLVERITLKRQLTCCIQVFVGDSAASFDALVDTGHSLTEPISKFPVIVVEFDRIKKFLPDNLKLLFFEKQENNLPAILQLPMESPAFWRRLRMIPFASLGRANGMLIGFRPDKVQVGEAAYTSNVIIGIYNHCLTSNGRYQGLISPELVG
jgi:stage II sporulation protein GA (sporulation sigma-E factor processing peptidase)